MNLVFFSAFLSLLLCNFYLLFKYTFFERTHIAITLCGTFCMEFCIEYVLLSKSDERHSKR